MNRTAPTSTTTVAAKTTPTAYTDGDLDHVADIVWRAMFAAGPLPSTAVGKLLAADRAARELAAAGVLAPPGQLSLKHGPGPARGRRVR